MVASLNMRGCVLDRASWLWPWMWWKRGGNSEATFCALALGSVLEMAGMVRLHPSHRAMLKSMMQSWHKYDVVMVQEWLHNLDLKRGQESRP